jgi:hypothetical protein
MDRRALGQCNSRLCIAATLPQKTFVPLLANLKGRIHWWANELRGSERCAIEWMIFEMTASRLPSDPGTAL